jgi:M6 family metalloprotease-like protein
MIFGRPVRAWWSASCLLMIALALCPSARADVVAGKVLPLRQPDGALVEVRIWGDEYYTVVETLDGYTLVRDPLTSFICYARLSDDANNLLSTGVVAAQVPPADLQLQPHLRIHPAAAAAQAQAAREAFQRRMWEGPWAPPPGRTVRGPTTGNVQGICLIVDFSDDPGAILPAEVYNYCNQVGYNGFGNNGSVRDYFYDVSEGLLTYTNYVPAAYYRALHPKTYYNNPNIPYGQRARELIIEALTYLNAQGFDFSQYDADGNGIIDALNCFYAGYSNSAWATGLWPHAGAVDYCADGVCTHSYQITDMQAALRLRTFCHENGHMLMSWPDLYDYGYESTGVGAFCLMAYSTADTNPSQPCAYMKSIAGWANVILLTTYQLGLPVPYDNNTVYKYPHPTLSNECYLIENRQQLGRDSGLPDKGLAIWHIDTEGSNNNEQQTPELHYLVTLVQADGRWDMEHNRNYGDNTDLWRQPTYTSCTPETNPNTNWWSGQPSNLYARNISAAAPVMTFDFLDGPDCDYNDVPDHVDLANCDGSPWCADCNGNGQLDVCDLIQGLSTDCNGNEVPDECDLANGTSQDCNGNGWSDDCDIDYGWSADQNHNDVPDECEKHAGDLNCDGSVDFGDINPFVLLITNYQVYLVAFPDCIPINGDTNDDGQISFADINPFVALLTNP